MYINLYSYSYLCLYLLYYNDNDIISGFIVPIAIECGCRSSLTVPDAPFFCLVPILPLDSPQSLSPSSWWLVVLHLTSVSKGMADFFASCLVWHFLPSEFGFFQEPAFLFHGQNHTNCDIGLVPL